MGTNFYIRGHRRDDDPGYHIGKRSAAGMYCWDCGVTLCKDGNEAVHQGRSEWHKSCPKCGAKPHTEDFSNSTGGRELGFNKNTPAKKTGVASCSSFSWALKFDEIKWEEHGFCPCCNQIFTRRDKVIEDEYERLYTLAEFESVLSECPIQYTDSIGQYFS